MAAKYASPPRGATLTKVTPFTLTVTEEAVQELRAAIAHSRLPPVTYEEMQQDRKYGVTREWLEQAGVFWRNKFDWYVLRILSIFLLFGCIIICVQ